jgi:predicted RNA-binding protein YlxR (DUF448 family)/ribosomal protein L7Ae-like RNA K-turn-binding protein
MMATSTPDKTRPERTGSVRTCAGCAERGAADTLVRVVLDEGTGGVAVDLADSKFGRGSYVHAAADCLAKAVRSGFARSFAPSGGGGKKRERAKINATAESIGEQLVLAADRRIEGLLSGARRAKHAVAGADLVSETLREGHVPLVVVAGDAAAAAKLPEVQRAIADGKAIAWNQKQGLGALFGRDEVAVIAVTNDGVASAIQAAYRVSRPFVGSRSEAWWSPEVR